MSSRPRAPWHDASLKTAKQERRKAERNWRNTGLEIHRQIYQQRKKDVRKKVSELKRKYINHKICISTTRKQLFKISSDLMGSSGSSSAPDLPEYELPDAFADFFDIKIRQLHENIDTASDGSDTDPFDHDNAFRGHSLASFEPISETEVRETILKCPPKSSEADPISTSLLLSSFCCCLSFFFNLKKILSVESACGSASDITRLSVP